jgi:hypothetical protein
LLLSNTSAIFQVYDGEKKLFFNEMMMMMMMNTTLYYTNTLSWIFIVLAHQNNSSEKICNYSYANDEKNTLLLWCL